MSKRVNGQNGDDMGNSNGERPTGRLVKIDGRVCVIRQCEWCGCDLVARRSTKRTCSTRCRVAAHRARKRADVTARALPADAREHVTGSGVRWADIPLWENA